MIFEKATYCQGCYKIQEKNEWFRSVNMKWLCDSCVDSII